MQTSSLLSAAGRTALLGFTAGLRSQMPLAMLARSAKQSGPDILRKRIVAASLYLSAAGELVGDKLPLTPARIFASPLAGRLAFGSLAGAVLSRRLGFPATAGIMAGGAGALSGSFAGYHARSWLGRSTGVPDIVWAGAEDVLAITLGAIATRERNRHNPSHRGCLYRPAYNG